MTFLEWLAEFIGSFNNSRPGGKAWNPVPIGFYADYIIRQMGATPAQIQKHIERVVEPEVEKDIPFVYIPDINGDQSKGHFLDKTTGQIYTSEQWYKIGPIYTALKKGEITEDEAYEQIGQVPDITGKSPTTAQEDEEEIVDVVDDDTTEELLADTTEEDTTKNITEEIVEKIEEKVVEDKTEQDKEPKTNVWRDSLEQARKEARERAKEQERIEQEKLVELRREKGYDDLTNTGKSIFDKMVEMGLDPDVNNIQFNYTGYGDYGPNYRNISRFFSNYNRWKSEQAKETPPETELKAPELDPIEVDSTVDQDEPEVEIELDIEEPTVTQPVEEEVTEEEEESSSSGGTGGSTSGKTGYDDSFWKILKRHEDGRIAVILNPNIKWPKREGETDEEYEERISKVVILTSDQEGIDELGNPILGGETYSEADKETVLSFPVTWGNEKNTDKTGESTDSNQPGTDDKNTGGEEGGETDGKGKSEGDGTGDGTGDGLGAEGLFGNLKGKGAQPELGKFQPLSIVNPVAPVSAAEMYRRPQYITRSLFSEYFE